MAIADINARRIAMLTSCGPNAKDRAREEAVDRLRRETSKERDPIDRVMISSRAGKTDDIKTGRPPTMKKEVREAWERVREEASIERLFK